MVPNPEHQDDNAPGPAAPPTPSARPKRRLRLTVDVPWEVDEVCERNNEDFGVLAHLAVQALILKLTPERGPADKGPYAGEICYFQRLLDLPSEVLALQEQFFVAMSQWHQQVRDMESVPGKETVHAEIAQAAADLAEWVVIAQQIVRRERGEDAPKIDWDVSGEATGEVTGEQA